MANQIEKIIASTFFEMAEGLETGKFGKSPKIALTGLDSEHGETNAIEGAVLAASKGVDVTYIGTLTADGVTTEKAENGDEAHDAMNRMLESGEIDGAVTMHYPFPIGVSTVGRVITPGRGASMFIATTTGTSSSDRVEGMVKNTIYGIITAKACGIKNPTVGILNVDGARQAEIILTKLREGGYNVNFAASERADGGAVMRGNDILTGAADIMVTDPLTGNVLIKLLSAYTTGGSYESIGYGYGPGIGEGYDKLVLIVSRASGAPVLAGALEFGAELVRNDYQKIAKEEFAAANKAGLKRLLEERKAAMAASSPASEEVKEPPKEVVTEEISGIEIMDIEDAAKALWKEGIYAQSGMGCTGPVVLVAPEKAERSKEILVKAGFINE